MTIPQLGLGAGYALWGFRAAAVGHIECPALVKGYQRLFAENADHALSMILLFTRTTGNIGTRRIGLAVPGCCGVTSDELSIVAVLAAAQACDTDRRDAHLLWLLGRSGDERATNAADRVGEAFRRIGLSIEQPPVELATTPAAKPYAVLHAAGRA
ncbi:MAG: hypothetical protein AAF720_08920 [Pseudomonadota bacterium]